MNRLETLEKLTQIQHIIDYAQKQVNWRLDDLDNLDLDGLPEIRDRYLKEIDSKEKAIKRLERSFQRVLLTRFNTINYEKFI